MLRKAIYILIGVLCVGLGGAAVAEAFGGDGCWCDPRNGLCASNWRVVAIVGPDELYVTVCEGAPPGTGGFITGFTQPHACPQLALAVSGQMGWYDSGSPGVPPIFVPFDVEPIFAVSCLPVPLTPNAHLYTPEQKDTFRKTSTAMQATALTVQGMALVIAYPPVKKYLTIAALALQSGALWWKSLGDDPPDSNFMVFASVVPDVWETVDADPLIPPAQATALTAWLENTATINGLVRAMGQTHDKAQGAVNAGNASWSRRQLSYYAMLRLQLAERTADDLARRQAIAALPPGEFPSEFFVQLLDPELQSELLDANLALNDVNATALTLTVPDGDVWPIGAVRAITWTTTNLTGNVKIELSRNAGTTWTVLAGNIANTGTWNWTVTGPTTTEAQIRITSVVTPTLRDTVDVTVGPTTATLAVTAPATGSVWPLGAVQAITWAGTGFTGNVKIELSRNAGSSWTVLNGSAANTGTWNWTVTAPATTTAQVRVTSLAIAGVVGVSPLVTLGGGSIALAYPFAGDVYTIGAIRQFTWNSSGLAGNVKVEVSRNAGATWTVLASSIVNSAGYNWNPVTGPASTQARIRVTSVTNPLVSATSVANFTIGGGTLTVTVPNGGDVWPIGAVKAITWAGTGFIGNVKIEVSRNGGSTWILLNSNAANGTWNWTVTAPATSQARVRVTSVTNPAVTDMSNTNFTVGGGTLTITAPNGGEVWTVGSTRTITWLSTGLIGNVKIELSRTNGSTWSILNAGTQNDGTFSWVVTAGAAPQARIRITSLTDVTVTDQSNATFIIP